MLSTQLFLLVSISVATADVIVDSSVQNLTSAVQVDCGGKVCKNFATCNAENTCDCRRGTKGDTCEVVDGCEKLKEKCDKLSSECIYDPDLEHGICKCHNEKEKFNGESCVECECGEFGTRCVYVSGIKYCFCIKGYSDADGTCSPCDCGEFEKRCYIGKYRKRGNKVCDCQDGYSQNSGICAPNCVGKVCKNEATCKAGNICDCLPGTKGEECEVVIGCEKLKKKCDKINTECIYDPDLQNATCKCDVQNKEKFTGETCEYCDCGRFADDCEFRNGHRFCSCVEGYANNQGTCLPCSCGEFEKECLFDQDKGNKVCICKDGYEDKSGICTSCTCGNHTVLCGFATGEKHCICDEGYQFKSGTCEVCDCGVNSTSCMFEKGDKLCFCYGGNEDRLGICTNCECGSDELCAFTSSGDKKCDCVGPLCRTPWFRHPVFIVFIVLLCGALIFGASFAAYRKLRSNRSVY